MATGSKTVHLMSPEATAFLYPLPLWSESPNHSAVNFAQPDLVAHPLYCRALGLQHVVTLQVSWTVHVEVVELPACGTAAS